MKSQLTTLCYIEKDGKYLMLHRIYKKNDINKDKWIGIGGHAKEGESPEDCLLREALEETGLTLTSYKFRGIVTFCCGDYPTEYMCLYIADGFEGKLQECDEGYLEWVEKEKVTELNLWDGDLLFFDLIGRNEPFFSLKLCYDSAGHWKEAALNGKKLELFALCDEDGSLNGHVMERGMVHRLGKFHRTVHVWVIQRTAEGRLQVLLQKRSANKDAYPGCYDISSAGHIQVGDEYAFCTFPAQAGDGHGFLAGHTQSGDEYIVSAIRELEEELGICAAAKDLRFIGYHEGEIEAVFWGEKFIDHELSAVYLYENSVDITELKLQESEVEEAVFMDYEEVLTKIKGKAFWDTASSDAASLGAASPGIPILDIDAFPNCIFPKEFEMLSQSLTPGYLPEGVWVKERYGLDAK